VLGQQGESGRRKRLRAVLTALLVAFAFAPRMSAHDQERVVLYILNETATEGNMCVNGLRIRRENKPIRTDTLLGNLLCEDDILQRVLDPKALIAVWFVGAEGTKLEGYGSVKIIRLGEFPLGAKGDRYTEGQTWVVRRSDMVPIDTLIAQTHALLRLRNGDFKFEPAVEIDNFSTTIRQVLLDGRHVASIPAGENYAISEEALAQIKVPYTVTVLYGEGKRTDGGKSVIYRSAAPTEWKLTPRLISTEAEAEWDKEKYYPAGDFEIELENKGAPQAVVAINQKKVAAMPLGGIFRIPRAALAGSKPSVSVNVIYLSDGIPQGGPFRVYWKERLARVDIGAVRAIASDGTAEAITSGDSRSKPTGPDVLSAWTLLPN
jgi:hypothetical protein